MPIAFISHHSCALHVMGDHHPEQPARLHAINDRLISSGLEMVLMHHDAPEAEQEQLLRVHDADYIQLVRDSSPGRVISGSTVILRWVRIHWKRRFTPPAPW